ncbi:MAG: DUF4338 domain-containing protein, partial [Deltaproteobacteria bacterium]|nr:DUF4338 domain-containing protein [Deltaproteobacteria bacterium]
MRLPELRRLGRRGPRRVKWSSQSEWQEQQIGSAGEFEPLQFEVVRAGRDSQLWRESVERYHYLGCRVPVGAHLRYLVRGPRAPLACLWWSSPAWKIAARDCWIGWNEK